MCEKCGCKDRTMHLEDREDGGMNITFTAPEIVKYKTEIEVTELGREDTCECGKPATLYCSVVNSSYVLKDGKEVLYDEEELGYKTCAEHEVTYTVPTGD